MDDQQRARELKPCPFCGGQPRPGFASTGVPGLEDCGYCYIECCDVHIHRDDEDACAEAWNRRAALRAAPEVLHIQVRNHHESGSFYLREGVEGEGDRKQYWCELTCNTSFGTVGHYWSSMGSPAARFLSKLNRGYLIGKLWASEASVFCGDTAVAEAKAALLRERRDGDLSKEDAREAFDVFWSVSTEFEWHQMVLNCEWLHRHLMDCGGPFGSITNPQALGFWEELWPAFITELTAARPQGVKDV
jgi:hypothetical protein